MAAAPLTPTETQLGWPGLWLPFYTAMRQRGQVVALSRAPDEDVETDDCDADSDITDTPPVPPAPPDVGAPPPGLTAPYWAPALFRPGSRFDGIQVSDSSQYRVRVEVEAVDISLGRMSGQLVIEGLTHSHPVLTTFFDGEIIGPRHSFMTGHPTWGVDPVVDLYHWATFPAWPLREEVELALQDSVPDPTASDVTPTRDIDFTVAVDSSTDGSDQIDLCPPPFLHQPWSSTHADVPVELQQPHPFARRGESTFSRPVQMPDAVAALQFADGLVRAGRTVRGHGLEQQIAQASPVLFMRWKERFVVPHHRHSNLEGASFDGFYYVCVDLRRGTLDGLYYHKPRSTIGSMSSSGEATPAESDDEDEEAPVAFPHRYPPGVARYNFSRDRRQIVPAYQHAPISIPPSPSPPPQSDQQSPVAIVSNPDAGSTAIRQPVTGSSAQVATIQPTVSNAEQASQALASNADGRSQRLNSLLQLADYASQAAAATQVESEASPSQTPSEVPEVLWRGDLSLGRPDVESLMRRSNVLLASKTASRHQILTLEHVGCRGFDPAWALK